MEEEKPVNINLVSAVLKIKELLTMSTTSILVALDGRSGTGKSSIAKELAEQLDGLVIISDDFWVGGSDEEWRKKSPKEKSETAIDWKRLRTQVLEPLLKGKPASWKTFNWEKGEGLSFETIHADPKKLIILDGAYSARPELQDLIDLSILVETRNDHTRRERLLKREGKDFMRNWHSIWDESEDHYFQTVRPKVSFDLVIEN